MYHWNDLLFSIFRPEEKIKQLEKKVNELIEESCHAHEIGDYPLVSNIWVKLIEYTQNRSTASSAALSEIEKCSPEYMFYFVAGPWKGKRSRQKRTKALQPTRAKCFEWSDKPRYYIFSKYQIYAYKPCDFATSSAIVFCVQCRLCFTASNEYNSICWI